MGTSLGEKHFEFGVRRVQGLHHRCSLIVRVTMSRASLGMISKPNPNFASPISLPHNQAPVSVCTISPYDRERSFFDKFPSVAHVMRDVMKSPTCPGPFWRRCPPGQFAPIIAHIPGKEKKDEGKRFSILCMLCHLYMAYNSRLQSLGPCRPVGGPHFSGMGHRKW